MVAKEEWMPIDPTQESPREPCSKCGSTNFEPEEDVLDTWMDSSITVQHVTGWLTDHKRRLPAQLRPQGHDIIRTWAFYTILRSVALAGKRPWDSILVNGMVLGEDGHKMSKSLGNIIAPEEVIEKYSADSFRQWAAIGGAPGSDVMFRWKDVVAASRFFSKMWSIYRFSMSHFEDLDKSDAVAKEDLHIVDRWLFNNLYELITTATKNMDAYQFDEAFKAIRGFAWDVVADNYIELVKSRLYGNNPEDRKAAQYTLYVTIDALAKLLAPFAPFFAEEMYSRLGTGSVHMQSWPKADNSWKDEEAGKAGELIKEIVSSVRRYKSEHGIALNAPLKGLEIYTMISGSNIGGASSMIIGARTDIMGATNSSLDVRIGCPDFEHVPVSVKPNMGVIGPKFKGQAKAIIEALTEANPKKVVSDMEQHGKISLQTSSGIVELGPESVEIEKEVISAGRAVDVLDVRGIPVVIIR